MWYIMVKVSILQYIVDKVALRQRVHVRAWEKLKGWKERTLSHASWKVLVKLVAQAIPAYIIGSFALSDSLRKNIESLISRFYWEGDVVKRKLHRLGCGKITRRKSRGGLGFCSIKKFNKVLLAKQWWRLRTNLSSLLVKTLKSRYHPSTKVLEAQLRDDNSVRICQDKWLPPMLAPRSRTLEHNN